MQRMQNQRACKKAGNARRRRYPSVECVLRPTRGTSDASTTASPKVPHSPIRRLYSRLIRASGICRFLTHQSGNSSHARMLHSSHDNRVAIHDDDAGKREVKMEILLERFCYHPEGTLGVMTVGSDTEFYTVERPWEENLPRISCIPEGDVRDEAQKVAEVRLVLGSERCAQPHIYFVSFSQFPR